MSILSQQKRSVNTDFPNIRPSLDLRFALAKKLDPRITFTRGSSGTYFGPDGIMRTAGVNEPRFDHDPVTGQSLGLLVEEQRTNLIRNNTAQGAVVGNPGTLPTTSYTYIFPSGISREVTAVGTENGITYFDVRYYGVSSQNGEISWAPQGQSLTPVTGGQVVSGSVYLKVVSGTFANISNLTVRILDYNTNTYLGESNTAVSFSSLQSSTLTRYRHTRTTNASTNGVIFSITLNKISAGPVDVTLRIGMPQVEVGSFPTSVISTTNSTVTRSADIAAMTGTNFSSWYNSSEGSFFVEDQTTYQSTTLNYNGVGIYSGYFASSNSNRIVPLLRVPTNVRPSITISSITYMNWNATSVVSGRYKGIISYSSSGSSSVVNGSIFKSTRAVTFSTADNLSMYLGSSWVKRIIFYPIKLTDQQLINLTS